MCFGDTDGESSQISPPYFNRPCPQLKRRLSQKFGKDARLVEGFTNLSAMEIDPNGSINDLISAGGDEAQDAMAGLGGMGGMMQDLAFSVWLTSSSCTCL